MTEQKNREPTTPWSSSWLWYEKYLQPGVTVALLARNNGINDNLLFKWRCRYRHLADAPINEGAGSSVIIEDNIVPVLVELTPALLPLVSPAPATQPKPSHVCELAIGRARLKLSGYITTVMLATLVRELKKGRDDSIWLVAGVTDMRNSFVSAPYRTSFDFDRND